MTALSILLVTRNAADFISDAIAMANEMASMPQTEIIAVDGGSTDGTREALSREPGWRIENQEGTGLAGARNQALSLARGDLIAFIDVDDIWLPGKLDRQMAVLRDDPEADLVTCMLKKIGPGCDDTLFAAWTPPGCLFRRRAFDRVGLFDPQFQIASDHDWFVRARREKLAITMLEDCLLHKRIHENNLSHDRGRYRRELMEILRRRD